MSIQILMTTYNGEKYLKAQLDSILNQTYQDLDILIRDDGSSDSTISILREYSKNSKIKFYQGKNLGPSQSFVDLIKNADNSKKYYAFADQDDVWSEDKIEILINTLEEKNKPQVPLVAVCRLIVVDENLKTLKEDYIEPTVVPNFSNALFQNKVSGCGAVFNKSLFEIFKNCNENTLIVHDWYLYLIATCFGEVYFNRTTNILYRQHGNNVIGATLNINYFKKCKHYYKQVIKGKRNFKHIQGFYETYKNIIPKDKEKYINLYLSNKFFDRVKLCRKVRLRTKFVENIIFKIMLIFKII